jgi:hypothetical protein
MDNKRKKQDKVACVSPLLAFFLVTRRYNHHTMALFCWSSWKDALVIPPQAKMSKSCLNVGVSVLCDLLGCIVASCQHA